MAVRCQKQVLLDCDTSAIRPMTASHAFFKDQGRLGGLKSASHRWRSLIFPGVISTAAGIEKYHLKRGVDPKARERINELAESL